MASPRPPVYYDGDYSQPFAVSGVVPENLPETKSRLFRQKFHCLWSALDGVSLRENFDSKGPVGSPMQGCPLVAVSAAEDKGGGVCEFERTWAEVPRPRYGPTKVQSIGFQGLAISGSGGKVIETSVSVQIKTFYRYIFTSDVGRYVPVTGPGRLVQLGDFVYSTAGDSFNGGPLNDADSAEIWMGHIYVLSHQIPALPTLTLRAF